MNILKSVQRIENGAVALCFASLPILLTHTMAMYLKGFTVTTGAVSILYFYLVIFFAGFVCICASLCLKYYIKREAAWADFVVPCFTAGGMLCILGGTTGSIAPFFAMVNSICLFYFGTTFFYSWLSAWLNSPNE